MRITCITFIMISHINLMENIMWTKPSATELRFGFEVTMYVYNK